jgi:hypothetical protein
MNRIVALRTVHVVWAEQDGPNLNYRIYTRRLEAGTWTASERIVDYLATDPGATGGAKYPALAAIPGGELHLFWHDYRIGGIDNIELFTKVRPAGGAWDPSRSAELRLTTTLHPEALGDNSYVPVPAAAPDGTLHVAWYDFRFDGQYAEIFSKTRPPAGAWDVTPGDSADTRVSNDPDASELPAAGTDAAGNLHVVWKSGSDAVRYARRDASSGTWSVSSAVSADTAVVSGAPALTVGGDDAVHVVWPDGREGGRALWTRVRNPTGTWSNEFRLTPPAEGADEPSLDTAPDGTIHLVWHDGRVSLFAPQVFHRQLTAGGSWDVSGASDTRVSLGAQPAVRPSVLVAGDRIFVLWKDARLQNHEIFVRVGGPVGTDVAIAPASTGFTAGPNPAADGRIRFSRPDGRELGPLLIYDIQGRVVQRLAPTGPAAVWNGRRQDGSPAVAGVYFVRSAELGIRRITVVR